MRRFACPTWAAKRLTESLTMSKAFPIQNRLRICRKARGLTQKAVAKIMGLTSPTQISRWERGERLPNLIQALRFSALFRRFVNDIFYDLFDEQRKLIVSNEKSVLKN